MRALEAKLAVLTEERDLAKQASNEELSMACRLTFAPGVSNYHG